LDRTIENIDENIWNAFLRFTMVDSNWIFGSSSDHRPVLTQVKQGAKVDAKRAFATSSSKYRGIDGISFVTANRGWAVVPNGGVIGGDLESTSDGGATWTNITPGPKPHVIAPHGN
jgi:hypothetical protein